MTETPFMPKATAVWLVENTTLTFRQIANFCNLHELEVKGIADGDVAKGIKAYNPILAGQLSREEIESCSKNPDKALPFGEVYSTGSTEWQNWYNNLYSLATTYDEKNRKTWYRYGSLKHFFVLLNQDLFL